MLEIVRNRRSARRFFDSPVDGEAIDLFKEALLRSPTSKNNRPQEFIFVDDQKLIDELSRSKPNGSAFLKGAPLCVVIAADERKSDVWVEDCSIAAITLQYIGESLGLGSCWIQIRKREHSSDISAEKYVRKTLKIPTHLRVASIVAIGHRQDSPERLPLSSLDFTKIRFNGY